MKTLARSVTERAMVGVCASMMSTLPPCEDSKAMLRKPASARPRTIWVRISTNVPNSRASVPGKPRWWADSAGRTVGATSALPRTRATRSVTASPISVSVAVGKCGPCCSIAPAFSSAVVLPLAIAAPICRQVIRSITTSSGMGIIVTARHQPPWLDILTAGGTRGAQQLSDQARPEDRTGIVHRGHDDDDHPQDGRGLVELQQVDVLDEQIANPPAADKAQHRRHAHVVVPPVDRDRQKRRDNLGYDPVEHGLKAVRTGGRNRFDRRSE